jgi:hypothetical protein
MTTAQQVVDGAAEELGIKTAEIALEANDFDAIFNRMNDMLSEWAAVGLAPAFESVTDGNDEVLIDRASVAAVKYNLALRSASAFQRPVSQALAGMADDALTRWQASSTFIGGTAYPDSLPLGSGNRCADIGDDSRFFPVNQKDNF